ncbi:MAG: N-acetylmuramoyl-L-alanine amidase [Flavobacterium sp.]|nr:N-acetylmuramoyl-L-alanine amidase [Flavobacterium sp.]
MGISHHKKALFLLTFFCLSTGIFAQSNKFRVALDAGHGAKDFGAVYNGVIEKNIALSVALKVGKILEAHNDIEVIYTRKTDVFIDLIERANIANRADAHVFVSIHCNANKNTAAYGTETYVMGMSKNASNLEAAKRENSVLTLEKDYKEKYGGFDPNSPETLIGMTLMQEEYLENSISLATKIQDIFTDALHKRSRGVKQAPFMVLHKAYMPRVLIETGFISNPAEGAYLDSEVGQNEISKAIADAIISYKKEYFGSGSNQVASTTSTRPSQRVPDKPAAPVVDEEEVVVKTPPVAKTPVKAGTVFKVQLAASSTKLDLIPSNFNGLNSISMTSAGDQYRYMYGEADSYDEAKRLLQEAKGRGYNSAFVVAFRDGKKISVQEALK